MDQIKTGRFIAESRKELGLTQRQLADALSISDKTVSKWECGKGMPEVSLMLPLCEILHITVNDLLSGTRVAEDAALDCAEENMMDLLRENQENRKRFCARHPVRRCDDRRGVRACCDRRIYGESPSRSADCRFVFGSADGDRRHGCSYGARRRCRAL